MAFDQPRGIALKPPLIKDYFNEIDDRVDDPWQIHIIKFPVVMRLQHFFFDELAKKDCNKVLHSGVWLQPLMRSHSHPNVSGKQNYKFIFAMRKRGNRWNALSAVSAAEMDNLECLKWLPSIRGARSATTN